MTFWNRFSFVFIWNKMPRISQSERTKGLGRAVEKRNGKWRITLNELIKRMCWVMRMEIYLIKCNYIYLKAIPIIGCCTNQNVLLQLGALSLALCVRMWLCHMCAFLHAERKWNDNEMNKRCFFALSKCKQNSENARYRRWYVCVMCVCSTSVSKSNITI